jgi:hypothetical protein
MAIYVNNPQPLEIIGFITPEIPAPSDTIDSTLKDVTRLRKTYSYHRQVPVTLNINKTVVNIS